MCGSALSTAGRAYVKDGVWEAFDCNDFKVNILQSFNPNIGCVKRLVQGSGCARQLKNSKLQYCGDGII